MIRIELTRAILMRRFSNLLRNSIINFRMFLYLETCFLRVTDSLLCRSQALSKIHVSIYPYLINEWRRNYLTLWPAQQWNCNSRNELPNIKTCENWLSNFSENLWIIALKLLLLTWFLSPKSINLQLFTLILFGVGGPLWCWHL